MKCVIPGPNIKVFGRAIHSLAKIGDELYLDPVTDGLILRTVNSSWSAFACFKFFNSFFSVFNYIEHSDEDTANSFKCKVGLKPCLGVFRSLGTIEKIVEKCDLILDNVESKLIFRLLCKHDIVKTYNLAFIECESLNIQSDKESCSNVILSQSRLLADIVMNFQINQEEVSLKVQQDKAVFKNYVEDEPDPNKVIHTVLSIESDEFTEYNINSEIEITFCLKELRSLLTFSEATNLPLYIHFENCGKPIIFSINNHPTFEASFVLATLEEKYATQSTQSNLIEKMRGEVTDHEKDTSHSVKERSLENDECDLEEFSKPSCSYSTLNPDSEMHDNLPLTHGKRKETENATLSIKMVDFDTDFNVINNTISSSPPHKKKKEEIAKFFGMFNSTVVPTTNYQESEVLAPASDED